MQPNHDSFSHSNSPVFSNSLYYKPVWKPEPLQTAEGIFPVAGFGRRFMALIIDILIYNGGSYIIIFFVRLFSGENSRLSGMVSDSENLASISFGFIYLFYLIISTWLWGGPAGKLFLDLRVMRTDGRHPGFVNAFLRYSVVFVGIGALFVLAWAMNTLFPLSPGVEDQRAGWSRLIYGIFGILGILGLQLLDFFFLLFTRRYQAIHDFIAHTVVIRKQLVQVEIAPDLGIINYLQQYRFYYPRSHLDYELIKAGFHPDEVERAWRYLSRS